MLREGAVDAREFTGSSAVILPVEGGWSARVSKYDVWPVRVFGTFHDALEWRDGKVRLGVAAEVSDALQEPDDDGQPYTEQEAYDHENAAPLDDPMEFA